MDRKRIASLLLLVAVLATMSLAGFLTFGYSKKGPATVEEALNIPQTPLLQRLYPVDDKIDSAAEVTSPKHVRYITYKDRSTEDVVYMPGSYTEMISSQSYYAEQPGESGRRPYIARVYGVGNVVMDEKVQQLNGLLLKTTVRSPVTKVRLITDFAADGVTHLREQEFLKPKCCGNDEDLIRDERWRDDASHSLAYRNIYNADETRTITEFDEHMNVLKMVEWPKYQSISGMKYRQYYPGSLKLRLSAVGDYSADTVSYYREDGTLETIVKIGAGTTEVEYYDQTGTKIRLSQYWFRTDTKTDGVVTDSTYKIYYVTEYDELGNKVRQLTFNLSGGYADHEERYNVTIDGVKFVEVDYDYDKDQTLKEIRYYRDEVKSPPFKAETHAPADNLKIGAISPNSVRLQVQIALDLPIPPPQTGGY